MLIVLFIKQVITFLAYNCFLANKYKSLLIYARIIYAYFNNTITI